MAGRSRRAPHCSPPPPASNSGSSVASLPRRRPADLGPVRPAALRARFAHTPGLGSPAPKTAGRAAKTAAAQRASGAAPLRPPLRGAACYRRGVTVTELYRSRTGDQQPHQRTIDAALRRLSPRSQGIVRATAAGDSLRIVAERLQISHGSVQSSLKLALAAMHKSINHLPRYSSNIRRRIRRRPAA